MRRFRFFIAAPPVLLALFAAPLFHTHLGMAGDPAHFAQESPNAVTHAHLPGEPAHPGREGKRHADLDHSTPLTKSFVLLTDRPAPEAPGPEVWIAAAPAPFDPPPLRVERSMSDMRAAIHDPPRRYLASLRAPPLTPSI